MTRRYGLLLIGLLLAPLARAQHVDTLVIRGTRLPNVRTMPPGAGIDEGIIIRPGDESVYFIRRYGAEGDSVHAFIRRLPERGVFRLHTDSLLRLVPSPGDSLAWRTGWPDSTPDSVRHLFRLHTDSLRLEGPMRFFERTRPGARVEFWQPGDVEIVESGDSTVIRLHRPGGEHGRFALPHRKGHRPETRADGVLVVPDGRGGTWVYLPPKEE